MHDRSTVEDPSDPSPGQVASARLDAATRERLKNKYRDAKRALRVQKEQA